MPGLCRVGDTVTGTCNVVTTNHPRAFTGVWTSGSSVITAEGIGVIRVGDIGITDCGHTFQATEGSLLGDVLGVALVRVGDPVVITDPGGGSGVAATGSPAIFCT